MHALVPIVFAAASPALIRSTMVPAMTRAVATIRVAAMRENVALHRAMRRCQTGDSRSYQTHPRNRESRS
jgi:hypothetical protein